VAERSIPVKILRVFLGTNRREEVRQISPSDPAGVQSIPYVVFSADEKSYAYSYYRVLSDLWVVDGLR
jgi:heme oxygenase